MENNIIWHHATVTRERRERLNRHKSAMVWFTGLSGAGKSTLAHAVEERLHQQGCRTFVLDGDNVRHGISAGLGFSPVDRAENLRRVGEIGKLFVEAGVITLAAFISPLRQDRQRIRALFPHGDFLEIYCQVPLEICERRDTKGFYARAKAGEIVEFTGISAPYDEPENPDLIVPTGERGLEGCVEDVLRLLESRGFMPEKQR